MSRMILTAAFLLGAMAIGWIAAGFVGTDALALTVTLVIGAVYLLGSFELVQFRRATATLANALQHLPRELANLDPFLKQLDPSLQNAVRLRIEGERVALPGPVFAPYLVGLLVMLGLLGTFVGMVVTLKGAVLALEGTTELQAIRSGLAVPIKGLGLAFGTSVAGVAASAMLGLIATLSRRDRMQATGLLDSRIATDLRAFSLVHNRQETFKAMQYQAQALPELVTRLNAMSEQMAQMNQQLGETLLSNQQSFQQQVQGSFTGLATAVEKSLKDSLAESGRLAGESIKPVVEAAMQGIAQEAQHTQTRLSDVMQQQLQAMTDTFSRTAESVSGAWQSGLTGFEQLQQQALSEMAQTLKGTQSGLLQEMHTLLQSTETLVEARKASEQAWLEQQGAQMEQLVGVIRTELNGLRDAEHERGLAAVERLSTLESTVAEHLGALGTALEAPMTRLIETASVAPKAAAEVIEQLRREISTNIERDNAMLAERTRMMESLKQLMGALDQASAAQQQAVEQLVQTSAELLHNLGAEFTRQVSTDTARLEDVAAQLTGSSIEVASLSEAFGFAVELFKESNEKLIDNFNRIEASLEKSSTRSDEQLAYYVAQAREIIDLSMMSQKEVFEELRRISQQDAVMADETVASVDTEEVS